MKETMKVLIVIIFQVSLFSVIDATSLRDDRSYLEKRRVVAKARDIGIKGNLLLDGY